MPEEILRTLPQKLDPKHAALVVVDMQNDFCAEGGYIHLSGRDVAGVAAMAPTLVGLMDQARAAGATVVLVRTIWDDPYVSAAMRERRLARPGPDAPFCLSGSWGAGFYEVKPAPGDLVVTKHRFSAFIGTDLDLLLRSRGIKTLLMAGVVSHCCVQATAWDAFMLDYYVVYVADCTAGRRDSLHQATLENFEIYCGEVLNAADVAQVWQGQPVRARG